MQKCCKTCKYTELRAWQHPCDKCTDSEIYSEWSPRANVMDGFRGWIIKRFANKEV